jgi:hypothetical protein
MRKFDVRIREELDELKSARLEAAGMPVQPDSAGSPNQPEQRTSFVRVAAQSEAMARAQVAAVLGTTGEELQAYPAAA